MRWRNLTNFNAWLTRSRCAQGCILNSRGEVVIGAALEGLTDKQRQEKKEGGGRVPRKRPEPVIAEG
jgi:hypothetical protein